MSRAVWRALALLLVLTSAAATAFWLRLPARLPTDDDYRAANKIIAEHAEPGDVIVLAPGWADRGRQFLTAAPVEAGYDLAHEVFPGTRRWWLVALADAPRFDVAEAQRMAAARASGKGEAQRVGGLEIQPFSIAGPPSIYRFTDHLSDAKVSLSDREPCPWQPGRALHQCPRGEWNAVRAGWWEVQERPMRCMWAHPVDRDSLRIRFDDVPAGARIAGRAALVGLAAGARGGAPVTITVEADGQPLFPQEFQNVAGLQPFALQLPQTSAPTRTITFSVTTPNSGMRHFCFDAWVEPAAEQTPQVER